jgi:hypothetical protein
MDLIIEDLCNIFSRITLDKEKGCWIYSGADNGKGYIQLYLNKKYVLAHRFMHRLFNGAFPDHLDIHHVCYQRSCVNPAHLRPVPRRLNVLLTEEFVKQRKERLAILIYAVKDRATFGTPQFKASELKLLLGCRRDNGNNVIDVLDGIQFLYPKHFRYWKVRDGRGRRPAVYELRVFPGIEDVLEAEDINAQPIDDILVPVADVA